VRLRILTLNIISSKFTSVLNNYQQRIFGIIARDENLVKSDAKKCQQAFLAPLLGTWLRELTK
jgi:spore maturation protein CgeB